MKRTLIIVATTFGLLGAGLAFAGADRTRYAGAIEGDGNGKVEIKLLGSEPDLVLAKFLARRANLECEGEVTLEQRKAFLKGTVPLGRRGGFRAKDVKEGTTFKVSGKLSGDTITGKYRHFGLFETDEGEELDCDTGKLLFEATERRRR